MTQQIVNPAKIEDQLLLIWEGLAKENKMRASLFNLIIFNRYSERTDYFRNIAQKVVEKFPCRIIFISEDPNPHEPYLKTAVSVVMPHGPEGSVACDQIDIGVAGGDLERVPYVLLPHILPDLPVTLLWTEDPSKPHPLFRPLAKLANRLIFDSESTDHLSSFAKTVLALKEKEGYEIADLNWARTEGWRDLLSFVFSTPEKQQSLQRLSELIITYNASPTEFYCHVKIQSIYLLTWLADRLGWKYRTVDNELRFQFSLPQGSLTASLKSAEWKGPGPGTILSADFATPQQETFHCERIPERHHFVNIQIATQEKCDLPYQYLLGQTATGQSLVKEICMKGTSDHYLHMLKLLPTFEGLC
ncbi:MAG: glucose-6-phosphate dehydrogenase assembly protein OpcA [Verrucomicrobiota bacterium]|nr:glucose-6-phosphate dehydrogenase assembly protein OpcA [Verrucomicrobiota bacterium]